MRRTRIAVVKMENKTHTSENKTYKQRNVRTPKNSIMNREKDKENKLLTNKNQNSAKREKWKTNIVYEENLKT